LGGEKPNRKGVERNLFDGRFSVVTVVSFVFENRFHIKNGRPVLNLWQAAPQNIVHGQCFDSAFDNTGHWVIHQISRDAQRLGQQFIDAA
jgi:hypothetical protein